MSRKRKLPIPPRRACTSCERPFTPAPGPGRPPLYCSDACLKDAESRRAKERREAEVPRPSADDIMRENGFLTAAEVAARTGRSRVAVYGWLKEGKVLGKHVGGRYWYVAIKSLRDFLGAATADTLGIR